MKDFVMQSGNVLQKCGSSIFSVAIRIFSNSAEASFFAKPLGPIRARLLHVNSK